MKQLPNCQAPLVCLLQRAQRPQECPLFFAIPRPILILLLASGMPVLAQTLPPGSLELDPALAPAKSAFNGAKWTEADQLLRHYLLAHPDSAQANYLLATALFHENKPAESLQTFTRAAQIARPTALDLRFVALDYVLLNDYPDADKWITASLREDSRDGESWYALGRIRQTENRFDDAVAAFTKALEYLPRSVKVENNLGLAYEGLNQPDQAIRAYRQAIDWQQDAPHPSEQPFINLGMLLTDRNQPKEALSLLLRAEALAPADPRVHTSLGRLYSRSQQYAQAQAEFEKAVAATPDDASLHFQLGQVYRKEGMTERSNAELARAASLDESHRR